MPYAYRGPHGEEAARLGALEARHDPATRACLTELGVGPGWRCWEIGAGRGSIAHWLAARVAPDGHVLATDVDTSLMPPAIPGLEIRRHDVVADPYPAASFDLAHARLVLEHLAARDAVVPRLAATLRPGGWLVLEDATDLGVRSDPTSPHLGKVTRAWQTAAVHLDWDPSYGRKLIPALRNAGLVAVGGSSHATWSPGGPAWSLCRHTFERLRAALVATTLVTSAEIDQVRAMLADDDGRTVFVGIEILTAWGRRPT